MINLLSARRKTKIVLVFLLSNWFKWDFASHFLNILSVNIFGRHGGRFGSLICDALWRVNLRNWGGEREKKGEINDIHYMCVCVCVCVKAKHVIQTYKMRQDTFLMCVCVCLCVKVKVLFRGHLLYPFIYIWARQSSIGKYQFETALIELIYVCVRASPPTVLRTWGAPHETLVGI